jgi:hypothetical protein
MKKDPRKYKWYIYSGVRKAHFKTDHKDFDFNLSKGETFGLKVFKGAYYLVDGSEMETQFKLQPKDVELLLKQSKGWTGVIEGQTVVAGEEGQFAPKKEDDGGYKELETTGSAVIKRAQYSKADQRLIILFPNGDTWAYSGVTPTEAKALEKSPSQGRFFNLAIKPHKYAEMLESATVVRKHKPAVMTKK